MYLKSLIRLIQPLEIRFVMDRFYQVIAKFNPLELDPVKESSGLTELSVDSVTWPTLPSGSTPSITFD